MKLCLALMLLGTAITCGAQNNSIVWFQCTVNDIVNPACQTSANTTRGNGLVTISIVAGCSASNETPTANQYAEAINCSNDYKLGVKAWTENEDVYDDVLCRIITLGEVDAEGETRTLGGVIIETTYSGEDCKGEPFESAPGAILVAPC